MDVMNLLKKYGEIVPALFVIAFAIFYYYTSLDIEIRDAVGGAALVPRILAGILIVCSISVIIGEILEKKAQKSASQPEQTTQADEKKKPEIPSNYKAVVLTLLALIGFAVLLGHIGFIASAALYLFFQIMLLSPNRKKPKTILTTIAVSAIFPVFINLLFFYAFRVMLPTGTLWHLF